jgi:hypothetical protein
MKAALGNCKEEGMSDPAEKPDWEAEEALRSRLAQRSAFRRDQLLSALNFDLSRIDRAVNRLIKQGEVEILRAWRAQAESPCFYRLRRQSDDDFAQQMAERKPLPVGRMFDAHEMQLG